MEKNYCVEYQSKGILKTGSLEQAVEFALHLHRISNVNHVIEVRNYDDNREPAETVITFCKYEG